MGRTGEDGHDRRDDHNGLIRSVDRALDLLETISAQPSGLSLVDLARQTTLPASTTHRLLTTLQQRGFVRFDRTRGRWLIGRAALTVGANYAGSRDMVALARPILQRFSAACGEMINLGVIDNGQVVFLQRVDPRARKSYVPASAPAIPLHCSSIGKTLLAVLPERELQNAISPHKLVPLTPNTIVNERAFRRELETACKNGFAVDDEENTIGLRCIAAPVFDEYRRPVAAVSMAAPADRLKKRQVAANGAMIKAAAGELTALWGGFSA
ncbi:IclR family transcriptional regulator [Pseudorhodoplanes sinuspersici]|nr:IclR family transcriptional regulator [Pseudorhodoplanes sinuspersici]RKE67297.1 IclR family transcriptional regulator [Pseudorhodoplanes sinuspersici]